jgi:hypothetical protein
VTLDWLMYDDAYRGKRFDAEGFMKDRPAMIGPEEISAIARRAKGAAHSILGALHSKVSFELKRARGLNKLFFGSLEDYPGTGNSPLFARRVIEKVLFRKLADRIWPSFMGRGADRDFNFQVAETFGRSYAFFVPLYLWRQKAENSRYDKSVKKYIID